MLKSQLQGQIQNKMVDTINISNTNDNDDRKVQIQKLKIRHAYTSIKECTPRIMVTKLDQEQ